MPPVDRRNPTRAASSESTLSLMEFMREYPDDETCLQYVWRERFSPDGEHAFCQRCEAERVFKRYETAQKRPCWFCSTCGYRVHPLAGTIFERSSTSLQLWFYAMYFITSTRCGISAKHLERELGVTYKTAPAHDAGRSAVVGPNAPAALDEAHDGWALLRVRRWSATLCGRLAPIRLTELPSNPRLVYGIERRYRHRRINHTARVYVDGTTHTQTIEGFFGLFKTGVRGAHHAVSEKWLQGYLNEWVWRYNRRDNGSVMFRELIETAAATKVSV